jgi:spore coat polysaccharide biosynthesis protein SpsF (cytidylyltransferase family)
MSGSAAIVLQARMGSRRLPGKTLALIAGRSVLEHCVERLRARSDLPVVLATTTLAEDDCIEEAGCRLGVRVVRGPGRDVLCRFVMVARALALTDIVRATADNPAVDMDAPRRVLEWRRRTGADHVVEEGLPYGATVEAIAADALLRQAALTSEADDLEHVTTFMRRDPRFVALRVSAPPSVRRPDLRLTLDTPEDLTFIRGLFALAEREAPPPVSLAGLIAAAGRLSDAAVTP